MSNTQSKIDSLQELNSQLIATIAELRKENAMLVDKEAGLWLELWSQNNLQKKTLEYKVKRLSSQYTRESVWYTGLEI